MSLEAHAVAKWVRIAPRKMRLVADLVRGKSVNEAINWLHFSSKRAAEPVEKTIRSAMSNLLVSDEASNLDPSDLFVKTIMVDEGPTIKRWRPRAMGRATRIRKRTSHLTVVISSK